MADNTPSMFDEAVRSRFARAAAPIARRCVAAGITPAGITWAGFVAGLLAAGAVAVGAPLVALLLWSLNRIADGLDGVVARHAGTASPLGGFWDISLDMTAYSAMVIGFAIAHPEHGVLWPLVLMGYVLAITTTLALSAAAEQLSRTVTEGNRSFQFTRGLAESGETTVVYVIWLVWPSLIAPVGWIWCGLLAASALQRGWLAHRALQRM